MIAVASRDTLSGIEAPKVITSDAQNERYIARLLELEMQAHQTAVEREYAELLTVLIEAYEEEHYPIKAASPIEVIFELMAANNLKQKDLIPLFGSESIVSEVLHRKRPLAKKHIEKLSERFHVSPAVFF